MGRPDADDRDRDAHARARRTVRSRTRRRRWRRHLSETLAARPDASCRSPYSYGSCDAGVLFSLEDSLLIHRLAQSRDAFSQTESTRCELAHAEPADKLATRGTESQSHSIRRRGPA